MRSRPPRNPARRRASILVIVLITISFATLALVAFMDKASNDLLVENRDIQADRLRSDAYSALEVTLATLADFNRALNGLHTPAEGWSDPLGWAGWAPPDGCKVDVAFTDESGKISLPRATYQTLVNLFESWQVDDNQSQHLADVLLGWCQNGYVYTTPFSPDYEQMGYPYDPPGRSLRNYSELASIQDVRDAFYDAAGRPNALWWRFVADVSLLNFSTTNINGATPDALTAIGQLDATQQGMLSDYLHGAGQYAQEGPQWFTSSKDMRNMLGATGTTAPFGVTIRALRVRITVHDGRSQYVLETCVCVNGGAGSKVVQTNATLVKAGASSAGSESANTAGDVTQQAQASPLPTAAQTAAAAAQNLQYPFKILEIRENDRVLTPPPPPS